MSHATNPSPAESGSVNGSEALLQTLVDAGVEVCFANPGTSEMHLLTAIGRTDAVRPVLCLFEGVASGAADGYARMRGKPAITLLHLGPGYANAMANLHNARRAHSAIVNVVGDHAVWHHQYDAPLTSDVAGHARLHSHFTRVSASADDLALAGAEAVQAARSGAGHIATLIAPANHAWEGAAGATAPLAPAPPSQVDEDTIARVAAALTNGRRTALVLGAGALRGDALAAAGRIHAATGAALLCETFPARLERGAGRAPLERIPYFAEQARAFLAGFEQLVLVGAKRPVASFAYPDSASVLEADGCELIVLGGPHDDLAQATVAVAGHLGAPANGPVQPRVVPAPDGQALTPGAIADVVCALLPDGAILSDEGVTCGFELFQRTHGAAAHDWLCITGGSIGQGLPVALGAGIACPDRKVVAFQADGSAMYTVQSLWSMVRENIDCTVVLLNNSSYGILNVELERLGAAAPTRKTLSMLDLSNPVIDWCKAAECMGLTATRATRVDEFRGQFESAMRERGPRLIEVIVEQQFGGGSAT